MNGCCCSWWWWLLLCNFELTVMHVEHLLIDRVLIDHWPEEAICAAFRGRKWSSTRTVSFRLINRLQTCHLPVVSQRSMVDLIDILSAHQELYSGQQGPWICRLWLCLTILGPCNQTPHQPLRSWWSSCGHVQDFGCCHVYGIEACGRRKYRVLEMPLGWFQVSNSKKVDCHGKGSNKKPNLQQLCFFGW